MVNERKQWKAEDMKKAVEAVRNEEMEYFKVHKHFEVPKITIKNKEKQFCSSKVTKEPQASTSGTKNLIKKRKARKNKKTFETCSSSSDEELDFAADANDAECIVCVGLFSEDTDGEEWATYSKCFKWGHEKGTGF
ncbi:Homeobox-like domain superfamily [Gonioctena quinquepunctata]|nr:Homeobox-like domain superfamily [Gonioctena quinquepunctata]